MFFCSETNITFVSDFLFSECDMIFLSFVFDVLFQNQFYSPVIDLVIYYLKLHDCCEVIPKLKSFVIFFVILSEISSHFGI